jgi:DNA mismatch endonuclease (patch repair protein)
MSGYMTPEQRSRAMKAVKLKGGPLERLMAAELRKRGLRFQLNYRRAAGSPDIAFPRAKVAVFVDGDFWHGWRLPAWEHKLSDFWRTKLRDNRARDARNFRRLRADGWTVIRIWEHDARRGMDGCVKRVLAALSDQRSNVRGRSVAG